ncbi:ATP-dependent nuclease [Oceanithermus sp.]
MRIDRVKISNFRSIRELEFVAQPNTVLIGPNNHGKSNILRALEFALSSKHKPSEEDFFKTGGDRVKEMFVELLFTNLDDQERKTFNKYLLDDQSICIRKIARINDDGKVETSYHGYVLEKGSSAPILEEGNLLGTKNVAAGIFPDFYLIPAIKEVTDELKIKTTTTMGKLLNLLIEEMVKEDPSFEEAKKRLHEAAQKLSLGGPGSPLERVKKTLVDELSDWDVDVLIEIDAPPIEKLLESGFDIKLDDGIPTSPDRKGHGLQRALFFALIRAWAKASKQDSANIGATKPRKKSSSTVFAIEEAELYLHPQAQKKLTYLLQDITQRENYQVFLTTHSPHFVDLSNHRSIILVSKPDLSTGTTVRQVADDLFSGDSIEDRKKRFRLAHWINPDRSEMFFARKVVFVEGETEKVVFPYVAHKLGVFDPEISIIDCGSKFNLPLYIEIANAFKLNYIVVHDEDPLPDPIPADWSDDKRMQKRKTYKYNETIKNTVDPDLGSVVVLSPDIERAINVSRSQGEKKGKALAAIEELEAMDKIASKIVEVVKIIYERGAQNDDA